MADFSRRFITSARRTWESSLRTVVASTPQKCSGLRVNWSITSSYHNQLPAWQGVETVVHTGCMRAGRLW